MPTDSDKPQQTVDGTTYPAIESLIEIATTDEVNRLFAPLKESLVVLKGQRAERAKKVQKAIERTEELLTLLLQVREKLEEERKATSVQSKR